MISQDKLERIYAIIDRVADEEFQRLVWGGEDINRYNTYVTSCLEAIEMLGDENFYNIVKSEWNNTGLSEELHVLAQDFVNKIDAFQNDDLSYEDLSKNKDWNQIVSSAKQLRSLMIKELNIDINNPPIW